MKIIARKFGKPYFFFYFCAAKVELALIWRCGQQKPKFYFAHLSCAPTTLEFINCFLHCKS